MRDDGIGAFREAVLGRFKTHGRSLPWRETSDPYAILVSEIMLQQTQVGRVVPKWRCWLESFPTPASLASASFRDVLTAWSGLGYNRRAVFLHDACKEITRDFSGALPRTVPELEGLPGVGHYTARAVSTFAFGNPEVFIETNIRRLLLFFFFPDRDAVSDKELFPILEASLDREAPREWYWAMMDYGAELAKAVTNPNRRSARYAKQSNFSSSVRKVRGEILRLVLGEAALPYEKLKAAVDTGDGRFERAFASLADEEIVAEASGMVSIAGR